MNRKFHSSTYQPKLNETQHGEWYITFELYEGVGISDVDNGNREAAILLPKGTLEADAREIRNALHVKGAKIVYIE